MEESYIYLNRSAELIIQRLLAVKPKEQVAIVCDLKSDMNIAYTLANTVERFGGEYTILIMPERLTEKKNELTRVIETGLAGADCLIGMTGSCGAPTYSAAVKALYEAKKIRTISMVMRNRDNFTSGGALADYDRMYDEGKRLATIWNSAKFIQVTSPAGTDLKADIFGEKVIIECGFATEPGQEAAFSDGEVSQMPRQNSSEGIIVVDGPMAHLGQINHPITLYVKQGHVVDIKGDSVRTLELQNIIKTVDNADNIAEIGIGLNPMSRHNGDFEEEKKARGNVHIALGDNIFYGGNVLSPVHMDMVIYNPTVKLDGRVIVDNGLLELP